MFKSKSANWILSVLVIVIMFFLTMHMKNKEDFTSIATNNVDNTNAEINRKVDSTVAKSGLLRITSCQPMSVWNRHAILSDSFVAYQTVDRDQYTQKLRIYTGSGELIVWISSTNTGYIPNIRSWLFWGRGDTLFFKLTETKQK